MENSDIVKVFVQSPREELRPFIKRFLVAGFSSARKDSHLTDTDVGHISNAVRNNNWHCVGLGSSPPGWRGRTLLTLTHSDLLEAIQAFADKDISRTKYYPEDRQFLL